MLEDRRRYRILYTEAIGVSPDLDRRRREVLHSSCALCAEQLQLCAEARGESRPDGYYELAAVAIMGAAREMLMQFVEGQVSVTDPEEMLQALMHLSTLFGEAW